MPHTVWVCSRASAWNGQLPQRQLGGGGPSGGTGGTRCAGLGHGGS